MIENYKFKTKPFDLEIQVRKRKLWHNIYGEQSDVR